MYGGASLHVFITFMYLSCTLVKVVYKNTPNFTAFVFKSPMVYTFNLTLHNNN